MKKILPILICLLLSYVPAAASNPNQRALDMAKKVIAKQKLGIKPYLGEDGRIIYPYSAASMPIVAKPFNSTEIELEPGEAFVDANLGDKKRWTCSYAYHGEKEERTLHFFAKPAFEDLETSLTILTNRRTYRFRLISHLKHHMDVVSFQYENDFDILVEQIKKDQARHNLLHPPAASAPEKESPGPTKQDRKFSAADLDFDYAINGKADWKPVRVYNNGIKTVIELPDIAKSLPAPILSILGKGNVKEAVNYRLKNNKFEVDKLFNKAVLVSGVGKHQEIVTIEYAGKE